jgi:hypothetical protein
MDFMTLPAENVQKRGEDNVCDEVMRPTTSYVAFKALYGLPVYGGLKKLLSCKEPAEGPEG